MQGGCFTISSIGGLGTTHFAPFFEMVVSSRDSSVMLFLFTSLKTGTTRPFGVSTAKFTPVVFIMKAVAAALEQMPRFNSSLSEDGQRLTGICSSAAATAFMMKTTGVNFTSSLRFSASAFCCFRCA
jgi:pyruvate/2-oxoglutarate dehydrogenase complex dihydrolipoamide acyltransferase (E2) component